MGRKRQLPAPERGLSRLKRQRSLEISHMPGLRHRAVVILECSAPWHGPELVLEFGGAPNAAGFNAASSMCPAWGLAVHLRGGTPRLCPNLLPKPQRHCVWIQPQGFPAGGMLRAELGTPCPRHPGSRPQCLCMSQGGRQGEGKVRHWHHGTSPKSTSFLLNQLLGSSSQLPRLQDSPKGDRAAWGSAETGGPRALG